MRRSNRPTPDRATRLGGRPNLVLLTHVSYEKTRHPQTTFGRYAAYKKHVERSSSTRLYAPRTVLSVYALPCGTSQPRSWGPWHCCLYTSTVARIPKRTRQYTIPSVCLHTLGGDAGLMMTDEATPRRIAPWG
jgi:hypothetical protein